MTDFKNYLIEEHIIINTLVFLNIFIYYAAINKYFILKQLYIESDN